MPESLTKQPENQPFVLYGTKQADRRIPDGIKAAPVEIAPGGALKVAPVRSPVMRLAGATLAATTTTVYTANRDFDDVQLWIANVDTTARTVSVYHIPNGGTLGVTNALCVTLTVPVGEPISFTGIGLKAGEKIQGLCSSANAACVTVYGRPVG